MNPEGSFFKFVLGFLTFISVSFVLTYAVNTYTTSHDMAKQTAAAFQAIVGSK